MELILWRHAEAEEGSAALPDHKRRLTPRGEKSARKMANWLRDRLPRRTRILVSPAERTQQTAHALQLAYEVEPKLAITVEPDEALVAAGWPNGEGTVLLIGHQPMLGCIAARLLGGIDASWSIKKGGVWWFTTRIRANEPRTVLRTVINPDLL